MVPHIVIGLVAACIVKVSASFLSYHSPAHLRAPAIAAVLVIAIATAACRKTRSRAFFTTFSSALLVLMAVELLRWQGVHGAIKTFFLLPTGVARSGLTIYDAAILLVPILLLMDVRFCPSPNAFAEWRFIFAFVGTALLYHACLQTAWRIGWGDRLYALHAVMPVVLSLAVWFVTRAKSAHDAEGRHGLRE